MYESTPRHGVEALMEVSRTLTVNLERIHDDIAEIVPHVDRIACALYSPDDDILKTFIHSTRRGQPIRHYQAKLSESWELLQLAESRGSRVINDIKAHITDNSQHSAWLLKQGYEASLTVPMYNDLKLIGFIFYDSSVGNSFNLQAQKDISKFSTIITSLITRELTTVKIIVSAANFVGHLANLRDFETATHLERMANYSRMIAKSLADSYNLSDEFIERLFLFSTLHDIGKIFIPDAILSKPGRHTPEERAVMETHVEKGLDVIDKIISDFGIESFSNSEMMKNIVHCHHELLDGSGYPRGLKAPDIPLEARIVAVADVLDALTSPRCYKSAWTMEKTLAELQNMADIGKLDADCVAAVIANVPEVLDIFNHFSGRLEGAA